MMSGLPIRRILTLPSQRGFCAERFKQEWPQAEIIGIERLQAIVLRADTSHVSALYHTDFESMVAGKKPQVRVMRGRGEMTFPVLKPVEVEYGQFDMAFLDGCGHATDVLLKSMKGVIDKFVRPGGVVGITASLAEGETYEMVFKRIFTQTGLKTLERHPYKTTTDMLIAIGKRS